ncbi:MAG TPA: FixH family protein [Saprospiraceae bacterium]|nr:FixH family protein [Saprospiraceae bacterium]HMQ84048.1 FixH family protein [Saprospiraceae bacterium]
MKFNWGTGIALFFTVFVVSLVYQVYKSTQYDNSLVSDEYYADDLKYQEHYNKLLNTQSLRENLAFNYEAPAQAISLVFPSDAIPENGEILFFCPSDSKSDFSTSIQVNESHEQVISTQGMKSGLWKIKVDWQANGKSYFKETSLVL